jgi:two-component system, sensor histidine kinase and response regulator
MSDKRIVEEILSAATDAKVRAAAEDLIAAIGDDIRDPMNGILGMAEVLLETEMTPQQRLCVEIIQKSGELALCLVNNAVDLAKITAGKLELEEVPFGLRATVEDAVGIFAEAAYGKGVELASLVTDDVPDILLGDPERLRQILVNLIGNAVKSTYRGEITVTVKNHGIDDDSVLLHCEIVDTGVGAPPDARRRISGDQPEADGAATSRPGGKGLSIVRELVALHGGEAGVVSEPGAGSAFWFRLRFKIGDVSEPTGDSVGSSLRGVRALIVDDNPTILCLLLHTVTSLGMSADTALGGEGALALCQANDYDVILVDEEMPGMDGVELAKALRAAGANMDRIILLTAFPGGEHQRRGISAGIEWYLTKPVRQDLLTGCVASVVGINPEARKQTSGEGVGSWHLPPRILVVDDNHINREVCTGMLEQLDDYRVSVAANGREALEELDRNRFDLVLMDCQMPEMSGYEATGRIRGRELASGDGPPARLPIIALTAYAHLEDREHCLAAGMDDYLAKPFTKEQLRAVLHRWLPKREG